MVKYEPPYVVHMIEGGARWSRFAIRTAVWCGDSRVLTASPANHPPIMHAMATAGVKVESRGGSR